MDRFTNKDIQKILGLSKFQIIYWTKELFIAPEYQDATGRGTYRLYSRKNLLDFALAKKLVEDGISLTELRKIFYALGFGSIDIWKDGKDELTIKFSPTEFRFLNKKGKQFRPGIFQQVTSRKIKGQIMEVFKDSLKKGKMPITSNTTDGAYFFRDENLTLHIYNDVKNYLMAVINFGGKDKVRKIEFATNISISSSLSWGDSLMLVNLQKVKEDLLKKIK